MNDEDLPGLYQAADAASLAAQGRVLRLNRVRLVLVALAALAGVTAWQLDSGADMLAWISAACFVGALLAEAIMWRERPERGWYDGRAVAESVRTLSWKFAVGADPFPATLSEDDAIRLLVERCEEVRRSYRHLELPPVNAPHVTSWMRTQRRADFPARRSAYLTHRIEHQREWYATKYAYNRRAANRWRGALVALEATGAVLALLAVVAPWAGQASPAIAAIAGAVVAWLNLKQHEQLARAYAAAGHDLAAAREKLLISPSEEQWALEVNDAEDAISREHTLWIASRSQI